MKVPANMAGEALEEALADILDPKIDAVANLVDGGHRDTSVDWGQAGYDTAIGAALSALGQGGRAVLGVAPTNTITDSRITETDNRYVAKSKLPDIININETELYKKKDNARLGFHFVSDRTFNNLTISAKKKGAIIIRGGPEVVDHLNKRDASASVIGSLILFKDDVTVSEILEETRHYDQNMLKMNNDKAEPLRTILNEIDAKQYVLKNAKKYKVPRDELDLIKKQLEGYLKQLNDYQKGQ